MSNLKSVFDELTEHNILPYLNQTYIITEEPDPQSDNYIHSTVNKIDDIFEQIVEDGSVEIIYKFKGDSEILKNIFEKFGFSIIIKNDTLTLFLSDSDLSEEFLEECNNLYSALLLEEEDEEEESEEEDSEEEESEEEESEDEESEDDEEEESE